MPRPTPVLLVSEEQQMRIEAWLAALGTPQQVALRGRMSTARLTAPISPIPENGVGVLASAENSPARAFGGSPQLAVLPVKNR